MCRYRSSRSLFLGFCKPIDLGLLGRFAELEALHILKMNKLLDLSAWSLGRNLKRIELEWLPHVDTLPDLSGLTKLEEVEITTMKSLRDVSSIAAAPALRFLGLWDCKSLTPQSFECLVGPDTGAAQFRHWRTEGQRRRRRDVSRGDDTDRLLQDHSRHLSATTDNVAAAPEFSW